MTANEAVPGIASNARLQEWLTGDVHVAGELTDVSLIAGGKSNLTYRLGAGGRRLVLRRPPLGHVLPTAHDMAREYRVLTALATTAVPVPRPVAYCPSADVVGASFYVMEDVPGVVLRDYQDSACLTPAAAQALSRRLGETLAAIHGVDLDAAGLADFGRGAGYLRRQLDRWQRQWELSATREVPGYASLVSRLGESLPEDGEVTLVHGDFRLDNTIVTLDPSPRIAAVVDWEMATLGDPLADLGLTLTYWADPGEAGEAGAHEELPVGQPTAVPGFMTRDEFAAWYGSLTGRDVSRIGYYVAFGCFKLAVVMEGIHARYLKGLTVGEGFDARSSAVPVLIDRAHQLLDVNE